MAWIPGVPTASSNIHGYRTCRPMTVCHRTYGGWGGDYSVIQSEGLAHLLIGKEEGQWVQFGPTEALFYHCNGANDGYGIEMTGVNEDDFTDWQVRCLRYIVPWLRDNIGVPLTYSAEGWVNGHAYVGFHSHNGILTDDNTWQHTNLWKYSDWDKIVQGGSTPAKKEDDKVISYIAKQTNPSLGIWAFDGMFKRHVQPTEWGVVRYLSGVAGKGEPGVSQLNDEYWGSIPTAPDQDTLGIWMQQQSANAVNAIGAKIDAIPAGSGGAASPSTYNITLTGKGTPA